MLGSLIAFGALLGSTSHGVALAAVAADRVDPLPGFQSPLPSAHYSGYIPVGSLTNATGQLHYWFIESEGDPAADPLLLWLNGGPGSSSLIGLFTENGQVRSDDASLANPVPDGQPDGGTIPQLFYNPHAWTRQASVIYLESPKGVGFSYCDAPGSTSASCVNDDQSTALDAYEFLANWFALYPEFRSNDFYITGESYAGIYIPMLMDQVSVDVLGAGINLKGAAIGNGCWGTTVGTCAHTEEQQQYASQFFYGQGMYSATLREAMVAACGDWSQITAECQGALDAMNEQMGDFNVYNVYDECGDDNRRRRLHDQEQEQQQGQRQGRTSGTIAAAFARLSAKTVTVETASSFSIEPGQIATSTSTTTSTSTSTSTSGSSSSSGVNDYACGGHTAMNAYLASPTVASALHVTPGTPGMTYHKTAGDLLPLYADLVQRRGYRILIYSGDTDGCVPYTGSEKWTSGLNFTVTKGWHQWFAKPDADRGLHKAGYAVTYDAGVENGAGSFQFVTVNGAGHMVPTYQPGFAEELLRKFLADEAF